MTDKDPLDDAEPEAGRSNKLVVAAVVALVAIAVVVAAWFLQLEGPTSPPQRADRDRAGQAGREGTVPGPVRPLEPASLPPRVVDSHAATYPLSAWQIAAPPARGGSIERARILGRSDATQQGNLRQDDLLEITGWAGDPALGMRVGNVVLVACDQVFASVPVAQPRPDIASSVHRNLGESGWTAEVLLGHVPRCENTVVKAWAVAPGRPLLLPVDAELPLPAEPRAVTPMPAVTQRNALLRPVNETIPPSTFMISAATLPLRLCAAPDCAPVASLKRGRSDGYVIERAGDWLLIAVGSNAGWVQASAMELLPLQPASVTGPADPPPPAQRPGQPKPSNQNQRR